jgi:hypothetical protein
MAVVKTASIINKTKGINNMGIDLFGAGGLSFSWHGWRSLLKVAREFGWETYHREGLETSHNDKPLVRP